MVMGNVVVRSRIARVVLPIALADDVFLRLLRDGDGESFARAQMKNRFHLAPWNPTRDEDFFTTQWQEADTAHRLIGYRAGTGVPQVLVSADEIVGRVNLGAITHGAFQSAVLSYWIDSNFAGRGLMTLAVQAVLNMASNELGLHRIQAETLVDNISSQAVLNHTGFERVGHAPAYLKINGSWQGHDLFQKLLLR